MAGEEPNGSLRVPRWVLAFIIPLIGVAGAVARTEYRTNANEAAAERIADRLEMMREMQSTDARADETRFSDIERTLYWLCAQRARDDAESGRTSAGTCP
jgi:hypothetical protein